MYENKRALERANEIEKNNAYGGAAVNDVQVQKPLEVVAEEIKAELAEVLNKALEKGVPALVIEPMLASLLNEIGGIRQTQYQNALQYYNRQVGNATTVKEETT